MPEVKVMPKGSFEAAMAAEEEARKAAEKTQKDAPLAEASEEELDDALGALGKEN